MNFPNTNKRDLIFSYILPGLLIALPALLYITYRAVNLSFTHDESLSFFIANGDPSYALTPNNHLLNTVLMRTFGNLFGNSEFALRLPNILAFILYCAAGLSIIKNLKKPEISILLFAILVLNCLMFEFFGLARGYGISMGMLMVSFYFFTKLSNQALTLKTYTVYVACTLLFSQLALYANFNALNVHLAILPALLFSSIQFAKKKTDKQNRRSAILLFLSVFIIDLVALIPAILRLKFMEGTNELAVFGNHNGLWQTTIKSLLTAFYYHQQDYPVTFNLMLWSVASIFVLGCIWFLRNIYYKEFNNFTLLFFIFCLYLLAPVLQEFIFNIPYPFLRTAIMYFPVFSLVIIFLFSDLYSASKSLFLKAGLIVILTGVSAFTVYAVYVKRNFTNTSEWYYDKYDKEMLDLIDKDRLSCKNPDSVSISNHWTFTPVINFYRVTKNYSWLKPVNKEDYKKADYYICYTADVSKIPADSLQLIKSFDDISVALYKEYIPK
jgi:hypothetical protein